MREDAFPSFPMSEAQRVAVPADQFNALAHSLAYESCASMIDSYTVAMGESLGCTEWQELPSDPAELALLADPLRYLDARGLIERHPHMPTWITLIDESEATR
jgi:hypothetical protein